VPDARPLIAGKTTATNPIAELIAIDKRVFAATGPATRAAAAKAKTSVKAQMRGRPRWSHRGKWGKRAEVNIDGPVRKKRSGGGGGPGLFSGQLRKSIVSSKRPRMKAGGNASSALFASSKYNRAISAYASKTEANFPYFATGIRKVTPKIPAIFEAAWAKATTPKASKTTPTPTPEGGG